MIPEVSRTDRRRFLRLSAAGVLPLTWTRLSAAAEVVKALVGFPPGGAIDTTARVYAETMRSLGTVIVENRPGAAGNIAAGALAQAKPDGTTLMFAPVNVYCISQALYRSLPFDAVRDFAPVGIAATFPWALTVHPSVPANTLAEFITWAKDNPDKAQCGMAAVGSEGHLMAYGFAKTAGLPITFVPYKGGAPMAQDLMAGHILVAFDPIVNMGPPHKAGKVRILALTGTQRSPALPEAPTFLELGHAAMTGETWIGVAVRAGTPPAAVQAAADALAAASRQPIVRERLAAVGLNALSRSPAEMTAQIAADTALYGRLVRELNLKID
jgi:tripartite-type tricarboxylate transporter receptor subunit TctC